MRSFYPGTLTDEVSEREKYGRAVARKAAAEGFVLLENDGVLPLSPEARIALYGTGARYTIKGGTGSGDVNSRDNVTVEQGLLDQGFTIVNTDYLDAYDREYRAAYEEWKAAIYEEGQGDSEKFYAAHARLKLNAPAGEPITKDTVHPADVAVYILSRTSGEGADRYEAEGDYYLSGSEREQLSAITSVYEKTVIILNIGGVIDLGFLDDYSVSALLYMSQAGIEGGNAIADVLSGQVTPSGKLTDTFAYHYADYPSSAAFSHNNGNTIEEFYTDGIYVGYRYFDTFGVKVRYPFGYGLSYTQFAQEITGTELNGCDVSVKVRVCNTGSFAGKQIIQLYAACPAVEQDKECKRLVAFGKTGLLAPGAEEELCLSFNLMQLASYRTAKAAYYLEKGEYILLAATSAVDYKAALRLTLANTVKVQQLTNICQLFDRMEEIVPDRIKREENAAHLAEISVGCPVIAIDAAVEALIKEESATCVTPALDKHLFERAREITAALSAEEKVRLVTGERSAMSNEIVGAAANTVPGAAGETVKIEKYGIQNMVLADGPAGIRVQQRYEINPADGEIYGLNRYQTLENRFFGVLPIYEGAESRYQFATAIPVGTLLAQSFDLGLMEEVGEMIAGELKEFGIHCWLAPGMNIHRNPLCGRNFEYYSEDPLVSGLMAAAITRGVQHVSGVGTTIKHFACNNQEDSRFNVTSNISERALREIYLKGFEIAVETSQPMAIMTSYNRVNSIHTANSYDLCTMVARGEWGFAGFIMTDWNTTTVANSAYASKCILAGNDLIMPGSEQDREEILDALYERKDVCLPMEKLDESVARMVYSALKYCSEGC